VAGKMKSERRKFTRFIVKENLFYIFKQGSKRAGKLIDISNGGLAYHYKPIKDEMPESNMYDIISAGSQRFYICDIICKTIYDTSDFIVNPSFIGAERRRRGLQYGMLTENQIAKFELLVRNYVDEPSDNSDIK
jgi:hypothetical protein